MALLSVIRRVYFGLQYWPQLQGRPWLTPMEVLKANNLAALRA